MIVLRIVGGDVCVLIASGNALVIAVGVTIVIPAVATLRLAVALSLTISESLVISIVAITIIAMTWTLIRQAIAFDLPLCAFFCKLLAFAFNRRAKLIESGLARAAFVRL